MQDLRFHYSPRSAALNDDPSDILVPALAKLRQCTTAWDVVMLIETLPDGLLPALTWEASRKSFIPRAAIRALIKACGAAFLEGQLGKSRSRMLIARYSDWGVIAGL